MRRWIFPLAVVAFLVALIARRTELDELALTLAQGRWPWVAAAAALQVAYYLLYAALCRAAFGVVGMRSRFREVLAVLLGSMFANVVVPSGGAAGAALFLDDAARRGESPARAAAGLLLAMTAILTALALVLAGSLVYLARRHELQALEVWGAVALAAMVAGLLLLIVLGLRFPRALHALLRGAAAVLGGLTRALRLPGGPDADWAARTAREFEAVAGALRARPLGPALLLAIALAMTALDVASLGALFLAFRQAPWPGVVVAGYAFGILSWLLSPVPQGIGVVEGVMTLVYSSLGVRAEPATLIVLSFRGLTFWLPMFAGFLLLRRLRSLRPEAR
jgi:putative heme transporter